MKDCYNSLKEYFQKIVNQSLITGIFPTQLKITKIIPVFKSGAKSILNNHRPIAIILHQIVQN